MNERKDELKAAIEAILFVAGEAVPGVKLASTLSISGNELDELIAALQDDLQQNGSGLALIKIAGGYRLCTKAKLAPYLQKFTQVVDKKLSQPLLETLSIVAFKQPVTKQEIEEIISYLLANLNIKTTPVGDDIIPGLELYGCYTREEIFTLAGRQTDDRKMQGTASGVFNLPEHNATILFVTLNKSEKDFSPSTQYNDYLINEKYFHWQSQNTDSHTNNGGRRYTEQNRTKNKIILFVREEKKDGFGNTSPFHCFGLVDYVSSHDDFPMNVTWKLQKPAMAQYLTAI